MSDVKFACPHCAQHIVCDDAWCRNPINCPACGKMLIVPPLAAFGSGRPGKLELSLPVGLKTTRSLPTSASLEAWSEEAWQKHSADVTGESTGSQSLVWVFLIAPVPVGIWLGTHNHLSAILPCFLIFATISGFVWAGTQRERGPGLILAGLLGALGVLAGYAAIAGLLLFAGCLLL